MSSNTSGEGQIRESMVRGDVVDNGGAAGQLFLNTQIPVCLWFRPTTRPSVVGTGRGDLFIDARQMGSMLNQVERVLTDEDIAKVAGTVHTWRVMGKWRTL